MFEKFINRVVGINSSEAERKIKEIENPELEKVMETFTRNAEEWSELAMFNGLDTLDDSGRGHLPDDPSTMCQRVLKGIFSKFGDQLATYEVEKASLKMEGGIPLDREFDLVLQMLVTTDWIEKHGKELDRKSINVLLDSILRDIILHSNNLKDFGERGMKGRKLDEFDSIYFAWEIKQHHRSREQLASILPFLDEEVRHANEEILRKTDLDRLNFDEATKKKGNLIGTDVDITSNSDSVKRTTE